MKHIEWPSTKHLAEFVLGDTERFNAHVIATEKIDGTNVCINEEQQLFGRHHLISTDSYQKCKVSHLKEIDIKGIKKEVSALVGVKEEDMEDFNIYGELGCNRGLYNYDDVGYTANWTCFGAIFFLKDLLNPSIAMEIGELEGRIRVKIIPSPQFFAILDTFNVRHTKIVFEGTFGDLVDDQKSWMLSGLGEGLIISMKVENWVLLKWKQSHESQPSTIRRLKNALETRHNLREQSVIEDLLLIACKETNKMNPIASLSDTTITDAISSAATKFDALDVYFSLNQKEKIIKMYIEEVASDLQGVPVAQISANVKKYVGVKFSIWKKSMYV